MNRTRWIVIALVAVLLLGAVGVAYGVGSTAVERYVFGGGGNKAQSAGGDVTLNATLGQTAIGFSTDGEVELSAGYWTRSIVEYKIFLPSVIR